MVDLDFTKEGVAFRDQVGVWLAVNVPTKPRPHGDGPDSREFDLAWQRAQYDGGWSYEGGFRWGENLID